MLSFARLAFGSVVRNRRRTVYAVVGIALAMSLVSGSSIAVDSSAYGLLRSAIGGIPVDFIGSSGSFGLEVSESELADSVAALKTVDHVEKVLPMVTILDWRLHANDTDATEWFPYYWYPNSIAFVPTGSESVLQAYGIDDELPDSGTVAIPASLASVLGLEEGDPVVFTISLSDVEYVEGEYVEHVRYVNVSTSVSRIWSSQYDSDYFTASGLNFPYGSDAVYIGPIEAACVMSLADMTLFTDALMADGSETYIVRNYFVWIDRAAVIYLGNPEATLSNLEFMAKRLTYMGGPWNIGFDESPLASPIVDISADLQERKTLFLGLSLPVMVLGVYLSMVGIELGMTQRRRDTAILKSRGGSNRQVFSSFMFESVVLGAISGVMGLLGGMAVSRFILSAVEMASSEELDTYSDWMDFMIMPSTIVVVMALGILLMVLSSYIPLKRVSRMKVAEALHQYVPSAEAVRYKPHYDVVALLLVGWIFYCVIMLPEGWYWGGRSYVIQLVFDILILVGVTLMPIVPFLLSISLVRLLTRGTRKLYTRFTKLVRPWTAEMHYLVDRNIARNPRRASNICLIVSLAVAFGLFVSVTMESALASAEEDAYVQIGSDMRVEAIINESVESPALLVEGISALSGVNGVAQTYYSSLYVPFADSSCSVVMIDSEAYADVVSPGDRYFSQCGNEALQELPHAGSALVSVAAASSAGILKGDSIDASFVVTQWDESKVSYTEVNYPVTLTVIGFVDGTLPGLWWGEYFVDLATAPSELISDISTVTMCIDVAGGVDPHTVGEDIQTVMPEGVVSLSIQFYDDYLGMIVNYPSYKALADFLYAEYVLSLIIMSVGVGLMMFVTVSDREHELACILARGSSSDQMRRLLMGESMSLMIVGVVIGMCVGLLSAGVFATMSLEGSNSAFGITEVVFGWKTLVIVAVAVLSFVTASLLATWGTGKMRLSEALRMRGG